MSKWRTAPISRTCEVMLEGTRLCGRPTGYAYPAMGAGWMALCPAHAHKHHPHCTEIDKLIARGETLQPEKPAGKL